MHGQAGVPDWTHIFNNRTDDCAVEAQQIAGSRSGTLHDRSIQL